MAVEAYTRAYKDICRRGGSSVSDTGADVGGLPTYLNVSTTQVTSSMVIEVSATFVESMTFLIPRGGGANTKACSAGERDPWSSSK